MTRRGAHIVVLVGLVVIALAAFSLINALDDAQRVTYQCVYRPLETICDQGIATTDWTTTEFLAVVLGLLTTLAAAVYRERNRRRALLIGALGVSLALAAAITLGPPHPPQSSGGDGPAHRT